MNFIEDLKFFRTDGTFETPCMNRAYDRCSENGRYNKNKLLKSLVKSCLDKFGAFNKHMLEVLNFLSVVLYKLYTHNFSIL